MNSLGVSLIFYEFPIFFLEFTMNLLYFSRIYYEFTLFFANSSCFHSLSIADSVRIHFRFREFVSYSRKYHELIICFTIRSLSVSWIYYVFIIYFADSLLINYLFREVTKNSLSVSRIHFFYQIVGIVFTCFTLIKCPFPHYVRYVIEIDYVIIWMTHMSHKIEFKKKWATYDYSYDYFHLLRNDYVIQKRLRNHYVKVWMTHTSHEIELEKIEWSMMTHTSIYLWRNHYRLVIWFKTNWYK